MQSPHSDKTQGLASASRSNIPETSTPLDDGKEIILPKPLFITGPHVKCQSQEHADIHKEITSHVSLN